MDNGRLAIGLGIVGLGAVGLWAVGRTSELPDVPAPSYPDVDEAGTVDPMIPTAGEQRLARAIATAEGFFVPGSIPAIAHNPGDLKLGDLGRGKLGEGITVLASDEEGWQRLYHQIDLMATGVSHYYKPYMTLREIARVWTGTQQSEWSANVARALGVSEDATLVQVLS